MKVNLTPYRIVGKHGTFKGSDLEQYLIIQQFSDFNSMTTMGIQDFIQNITMVLHYTADDNPDQKFYRPLDFEQAIDWVLDSDKFPTADKAKLLDLLNAMHLDPHLFISFS